MVNSSLTVSIEKGVVKVGEDNVRFAARQVFVTVFLSGRAGREVEIVAAPVWVVGERIFPNPVEPAVDRLVHPGFAADLGGVQEKQRSKAVVGAISESIP